MIAGEWFSPIANHLWQSTIFAAVAALLTLVLRRNHARVRFGLWLLASLKFLVPFSLLVALSGAVGLTGRPRVIEPRITSVVGQVAQPFAAVIQTGGVGTSIRIAPPTVSVVLQGI